MPPALRSRRSPSHRPTIPDLARSHGDCCSLRVRYPWGMYLRAGPCGRVRVISANMASLHGTAWNETLPYRRVCGGVCKVASWTYASLGPGRYASRCIMITTSPRKSLFWRIDNAGDSKRHANARRGRVHAWPAPRAPLSPRTWTSPRTGGEGSPRLRAASASQPPLRPAQLF
jgi:hypothetical protein